MKRQSQASELGERKAFILATVIYEYIATAEPVGSQTLTQKYDLGVSAATIRNEMADLEALGLLVQPHTSAGRVPSDAGYRLYVDDLMPPEPLASHVQQRIKNEFREASRELADVIAATTRLLGQLSQNLAFVIAPSRDAQTFRHIQLLWLSETTGLAIVVTSLGVVMQQSFEFASGVNADAFTQLSNRLNERFGGKRLRDIAARAVSTLLIEANAPQDLASIVENAFATARSSDGPSITSAGAQHLLDQPEFQDVRKLRTVLRIIEEQKTLYDLVADAMARETPTIKIGHELRSDEMTECSVVTMPYQFGKESVGVLAILGPRRMPYGRLLALASGTASSLTRHLAGAEIR